MSLEAVIGQLVGQGIVGIIAGLFIYLYLRELSEHKTTRNAHTADTRALLEGSAERERELNSKHDYRVSQVYTEHNEEVRGLHDRIHALRDAHAEREKESQRALEYFANQQIGAVEDLANVAEVLRRGYDRLPR